jgi:hypothetical protein
MNQQDKVDRWAENEFGRLLAQIIVPDGHGNHIVFGKYFLQNFSGSCLVRCTTQDPREFSSRRIALSWCLADRGRRYDLARQIQDLDMKKRNLSRDIECRRALAERSNNMGFRQTVLDKIQIKIQSLHSIKSQLEKCVNSTKYWQQRGFSNETARTGCSTAIKTNH